jgi:hypothetical protein
VLGAVTAVLLLLIIGLLCIGKLDFDLAGRSSQAEEAGFDFSHIMEDNLDGNEKIVNIAMLGAHDAFSHKITGASVQAEDNGILSREPFRWLSTGIFARLGKAQQSGTAELLSAGVRYFDIRITLLDGGETLYTHHSMVSAKLEEYWIPLLDFLQENSGEFVILDFQNTPENCIEPLKVFLKETKNKSGLSASNFIHYDSNTTLLQDISYNESKGGMILLVDSYGHETEGLFYERAENMRSVWHNTMDYEYMTAAMESEYAAILSNPGEMHKLRVNQAQFTPNTDNAGGILQALAGWSLLDIANKTNPYFLGSDSFEKHLVAMPIYMVDFADTQAENFNRHIIEKINAFNRLLNE